jgi:aspartyl aminopeptidase
MVELEGSSGGILYHAIIDAKYNYSVCPNNPTSGSAFTQNLKAGGEPAIDLGNSLLSFHSTCDGTAHVDFSCGKYVTYNNKNILLNLK